MQLRREGKFNSALHKVDQGTFDYQSLRIILQLIYNVQCNIFHGSKTFEDLAYNSNQKKRIIIYTDILAAFIQVIFSRLDMDFQVRIEMSSLKKLYDRLPESEIVRKRLMEFIAETSQGSLR